MKEMSFPLFTSHGTGVFSKDEISKCGSNVIFEENSRIFHPENVEIGSNVYIGHYTILKGYYKNKMVIGDNCWIGQLCFFHSAGGLHIGNGVGIGPCVKILTSQHSAEKVEIPIISSDIAFEKVIIRDNCDIGTGSVLLPGITIGKGSIIGAGSVVTRDVPEYSVYAGNPAKFLRKRA